METLHWHRHQKEEGKGRSENNMAKNDGWRTKKRGAGAYRMRCGLQQWIERNGDTLWRPYVPVGTWRTGPGPGHTANSIQIHSRENRPKCCVIILVYYLLRDWKLFCYVIRFKNIRIHFPRVTSFVTNLLLCTLESGFKNFWICCQI